MDGQLAYTIVGDAQYIAPETIAGQGQCAPGFGFRIELGKLSDSMHVEKSPSTYLPCVRAK